MDYNKLQKRQLVRLVKERDKQLEVRELKQELKIQQLTHELDVQRLKQEMKEADGKSVKEVVKDIFLQLLTMVAEGLIHAGVLIYLLYIGINLL